MVTICSSVKLKPLGIFGIMNNTPSPDPEHSALDFSNTEIAFSSKTNKELIETARLFRMMNVPLITNLGSKLGILALKARLPLVKAILKKTIFKQFCGGENLMDCQATIDHLHKYDTSTILDYGAEGKSSTEELDAVMDETIRAVELAASNNSVPVISTKITGLADNQLLIDIQAGNTLTDRQKSDYERLVERVEQICERAAELKVGVFVDAEESWLQQPIDDLVTQMMQRFNKDQVIVYNTYQMYRNDKLAQLKADHQKARADDYLLGAKLVRGAYMEKERTRAAEKGYPSPIHIDKASTDKDYDAAVTYCIEHMDTIASCCATHNADSSLLQARLVAEKGIERNHPHINFCQLYGMSDFITFNIADAGYNVAKYVPYGPLKEVVPYLIRRAQENTSVTGEMSRELSYIDRELTRRDLK